MAFTVDDFNKVWASTSPLTPYEFSESNYKEGWNFIGSTPPARQMWDFLQKQNDEKTQWLYSNKLSLSGGTMTGSIVNNTGTDGIILGESGNTGNVSMSGGETLDDLDGAKLNLFGASHATNPGEVILQAGNANGYKQLRCKPNGEITWGGNNVVTSNFGTFTVSKTNDMTELSVQQAIRIGNLAIVSFDGKLTSTKGAWTDTDIMTLSVTTSGTTYSIGLTNNGTSVLLQIGSNKVTYRTLNHAVNDDTIRGLLVFPTSGF